MKATNIKWYTDSDSILFRELPRTIEIPKNVTKDQISDYLSDQTGFCHFGYELIDDEPNQDRKHTSFRRIKMGYIGQKMSERAQAAYNNGEMPYSKWTKGLSFLNWKTEDLRLRILRSTQLTLCETTSSTMPHGTTPGSVSTR